ncbi:MAG: sugar phosphate isomerase/epimerase [Acidobacteria bacterium]|nr:sugar phosphate isomerase/epimerase [Acidobacteriota bacterium]
MALDGIAEAGYQYAGLMTHKGKTRIVVSVETAPEEAAAIGEQVRKRGLIAASIYGGDFGAAKGMESGIAGLRRLIDNCAACRCPALMIGGTAKPELVAQYYKIVAECCDYGLAKGVAISVKPHGGSNATGPQCRKLIETVGHKNFRVWYDPGNIFHYSKGAVDPVEDVSSLNGLIAGMSIKDYKPPEGVMVTPGTGMVRFRELMVLARKGGFRAGPLIVECLYRGEGADLISEARKARRLLERLTAE